VRTEAALSEALEAYAAEAAEVEAAKKVLAAAKEASQQAAALAEPAGALPASGVACVSDVAAPVNPAALAPLATAPSKKKKKPKTLGPPPTRIVRQILTSRRGQRPKTWVDWNEVHGLFLKWTGHKVLVVRNQGPPLPPLSASLVARAFPTVKAAADASASTDTIAAKPPLPPLPSSMDAMD
jgi:hypothetical protein